MKHIFIVDDDKVLAKILSAYLSTKEFKVTSFYSGDHALSQMKAGLTPDLIISDINMPHMDGYEFLAKVDNDKGFRNIPILLFSGTEQDDIREAYPKAKAFVKKPCHPDTLFERIKECLI